MVQIRSPHYRREQASSELRMKLSDWQYHQQSNNKEKRDFEKKFAITSQPQFVQPQASSATSRVLPKKKPEIRIQQETNISNVGAELAKRGVQHHQKGEYDDAAKAFQAALKTQMLHLGQEHPAIAQTLANIGAVFLRQGRLFMAAEALEEALQMKEKMRRSAKSEAEKSKILMADVLNNLGNVAYLRGDYSLSLQFYRATLADLRLQNGPARELANALHNIGRLHMVREEWEAALSVLSRCQQVEKELYGPNDVRLADTMELLGFVHLSSDSFDNAMISFSDGLSIYQEKWGAVNGQVASSLINVAMVMEGRGQLEHARQTYVTAREVFRKVGVGEEHRGYQAACRGIETIEEQLMIRSSSYNEDDDDDDDDEDSIRGRRRELRQLSFLPIDESREDDEIGEI